MEKQKDSKESDWNIRPHLALGLIVFVVATLLILVFFLLYRYAEFKESLGQLTYVLQPVLIGLVIAYLINPIMKFYEKYLMKLLDSNSSDKKRKKNKKFVRTIATIGALFTLLLIIGTLIGLVVPELVDSIEKMATTMPKQVDSFVEWSNEVLDSDNEIIQQIETMFLNFTDYFEKWLKEKLLPQTQTYIASITTGIIGVVKVLFNFIVGLIISLYVLMEKEVFTGQIKKLIYAIFPASSGNAIITTVRKSNAIFSGFIIGKIIDSAIIGVLCYIVLLIMDMPYTLLVSVIVGVTNVVPFFGPYIGAVPSAILITIANPIQGVYFVIFILILQQIDGNIIGPKIIGDSTGLSSFWVVFAIIVAGGLFGILGMILGVPTFAVLYYIMQNFEKYLLKRKNLPTESADYIMAESLNVDDGTLIYPETEKNEEQKSEDIEEDITVHK